ncbi:aldehyde dehydrogenase [Brucella pseudogrignonensis]|uniref:Lactaldehyde dehydrogenase/glycolaldehyde dehydrogenase n=1 Tax=Brucella pseudogrignonensis TaxID=419475 RepID=A0ABU1M8X4_9HYPH|nr:aldehyde dehydrogenase [Brucella pseudogrignonensis]MQP40989.1 aldehyde dehydrogenase [Ochrobactrum sp. MYb237]MDR6432464.1 lactaldehyde dehydrogenase/glycolaldehyde dehydrogenase [Brucella pseudogrignonensis]PQZ40940.1 aldehyde dehydrogenase [Brucella pseudogrignonensis]PRA40341.1 aldehyde dehydrogenase [Brucella pseudogrignonensis]PRA68934.1 aldehyde dehydrogenase [Brucella pseudogrignonensis]
MVSKRSVSAQFSTQPLDYQNYIDGAFISKAESYIDVLNPATGDLLGRVPDANESDVNSAVKAARKAQTAWEKLPAIQRAGYLRQISAKLREHRVELADIIIKEQGKTAGLAQVEVDFTADYIDYMAEWARRLEGEVLTSDRPNETMLLLRKPIGVVAGILPWNFPFFLIARKLAPALITGNTIVIKPSEETPINAFVFAQLVDETDLPAGVFNLVGGRGASCGEALVNHPEVDLITFTGSVATGSHIMQAAGKNLTRINLELGGKAPAIVLADADLDLAAKAIYDSRVINTGQVCNCAERVYVERPVHDVLVEKLKVLFEGTRYGDPSQETDLHMGPLINQAGLNKVVKAVETAVADGAKVVTGGKVAKRSSGFHYEPTLIINARSDMEIMRKETFGPVLPIQIVDSLEEAIERANDSEYGLTSSIYTSNLNAAMKASRELKFGETYINRENFEAMQGFHAGRRKSGIGGADGKHGLYEFTETHVIYIQG